MGSSTMVLSVWDWDMTKDDRIGTFTLDYNRIADRPDDYKERWFNLYGAPKHKQKGIAAKMNAGYIEGSHYRGRVLLSVKVDKRMEERKEEKAKLERKSSKIGRALSRASLSRPSLSPRKSSKK